ncbi:3,4-dihydroxy-2-butanone-4-phosphate synthase [Deltaproteobacteria bacterium Smac51]|nr:3,4-dihydroxy-2-butanone-4-phosphate synthase [Deltaproteobacteria bacterium Smac51]
MNRDLFFFGDGGERIDKALACLRSGGGVIVVDDDGRENEGDLIFPAESLTVRQMAMMIRHCSGIVCLCLTGPKASALDLPPMAAHNTSQYGTAFTVSIEAATGVTTGVSAHDRVRTVQAAIAPAARPDDLNRPGHIFPLVARGGGVLERAGHTEATVDLMNMAGLIPAGVLCELTNDDGTMRRLPEIIPFAKEHSLPLLTVADIAAYRRRKAAA